MNSTVKFTLFLLAAMISGSLGFNSCSQKSREAEAPRNNSVSLMVDAALRPVLQELAQNYLQETSIKVNLKFATSQEITLDNPADSVDVYVLANDRTASEQLDSVTFDPTEKHILGYSIPCIVVPQFNPALITALTDLANSNARVGISDPSSDVLGQFGLEILHQNRVYNDLAKRLVVATSSQDLAERVAKKELDAAIGWTNFPIWTQGGTDVVLLGSSEIPRIAAVCALRSKSPMDATQAIKLMTYLGSDRALDVFRKWGFTISKTDIEMYAVVACIGGVPN